MLAIDLPDVDEVGLIGELYEQAATSPKIGFYLETLGAALLLLAAVATLVLRPGQRRPPRRARARRLERPASAEQARRRRYRRRLVAIALAPVGVACASARDSPARTAAAP